MEIQEIPVPDSRGEILEFQISGRVCHTDKKQATGFRDSILRNKSIHGIIVDGRALMYLDSYGLGFFAGLHLALKSRGVAMGIYGLSSDMRTLFKYSGLDRLIEVDLDRENVKKFLEERFVSSGNDQASKTDSESIEDLARFLPKSGLPPSPSKKRRMA